MAELNNMNKPTTDQDHDQTPTAPSPQRSGPSLFHRPSYKHLWLGILALLAILALAGLATHKTSQSHKAAVSSAQVSIQASGFFPKLIQVKAGTTVTWTNYDVSPHQVSSDPYPKDDKLASLNSLALAPKDSFSYTFNSKGTFTYHDNLNPFKLQGTVIVK